MKNKEKLSVLFICLGNICRSPTADGVFRKLVADARIDHKVVVDSAGTAAWHIGKSPDSRSQSFALRRGYDLSGLRARQVNEVDFDTFDLLLAMDSENYSNLMQLCPKGSEHKVKKLLSFSSIAPDEDVPDPYYGGDKGFEQVLDLVEDACDQLLKYVKSGL
ncbi:low molecular weight protein-tyrosine-phosphatase [Litoribrevibacter albus]|uniref:low molecular weight protein-tyrosine-phosphatase n=1 Tax=Litoribrevibacter albus TaxID=1473156 RepID=UPI0024E0515F|nr:low molecular weight protein-tyrosine-phosphatase [Litoribrevibacter albus]